MFYFVSLDFAEYLFCVLLYKLRNESSSGHIDISPLILLSG